MSEDKYKDKRTETPYKRKKTINQLQADIKELKEIRNRQAECIVGQEAEIDEYDINENKLKAEIEKLKRPFKICLRPPHKPSW